MKRIFILLPVLALIAGLFTGCSKSVTVSDISSAADLAGKKIGVQLNTTGDTFVTDEFEGDEAGTVIERYNKGNDAISSLKNGKIDCVIIDREPAKSYVALNSDLSILEDEFAVEEYSICVSKTNTELLDKINAALAELKADGTIDRITEYYIEGTGDYGYISPDDVTYENGTLVMATNAAFPPYEYYGGGEIIGIDADIAKAIADKLHCELVIEDMEFDTVINAVQGGKADFGMSGITVTEDRKKNIDFTDAYATSTQVMVVRNGSSADSISLAENFKQSFLEDNRYEYIIVGLKNTLIIALFAVILGVALGFLVALIRATHDKTGGPGFLNFLCQVYLTVIRGTPTMIQILIIYYVIFASSNISKIAVAVIAFGINSGAYVAEIIRGGIMSLDNGQFEGARSLGLNHIQTMRYVIIPQTVKNTLPALGNEFIVLIKETSISGYIGLQDLTMGGNIIRGITYQAFFPLISVALIYLAIVTILTFGVRKLERRLKKNER